MNALIRNCFPDFELGGTIEDAGIVPSPGPAMSATESAEVDQLIVRIMSRSVATA